MGNLLTTLKELKNNLPIEVKGKFDQTFTFKDWGMTEEKAIAKMKDKNPSLGRFLTKVLSSMLLTLHGENFAEFEEKKKMLILNQLPMGSVLYMYLYLRYDQLGGELRLTITCPHCNKTITDFNTDIGDMDVECKVKDYSDTVSYKLSKPITLDLGNQLVESIEIGIGPWDLVESSDRIGSTSEGAMKEHTFRRCIVGITDCADPFSSESIIKKLRKIDIEQIHELITKHNGGPSVQAEINCSQCSKDFSTIVDWRYDSFFGAGSLPRR